jgi:hypothetical protein
LISDTLALTLLLAIFGSLAFLGRVAWRLVFAKPANRWIDGCAGFLGLSSIGVLLIDLIDESHVSLQGGLRIGLNLGFVFAIVLVGIAMARSLSQATQGKPLWVYSWVLASVFLLAGGLSIVRLYQRVANLELFGIGNALPGMVEDASDFYGLTDKGRVVPVFRFSADKAKLAAYTAGFLQRFSQFKTTVILREEASEKTNCHGWVFTGGRHLLRGDGVAMILADNDYRVVDVPASGDIVIYRDACGVILHTGLVQGVLKEGTVMIESKWGIDQRFLHLPEQQPYSQNYQYYHTDRGDHLIEIQCRDDDHYDDG